ncbi:MAG TPA: hypothetical protein VGP28_05405 [Methylocella sp.]|nr:hypothetical protein [Methylocella sp.]
MRTLAPNSLTVQSEIDALFEALAADPSLWAPPSWPFHDPLAGIDLAGLLKDVKPEPRRRHRSWTQRDVTRLLRGAKAAGVEVREIMPDGRIILVPTKPILANADTDENPWEKFRHG